MATGRSERTDALSLLAKATFGDRRRWSWTSVAVTLGIVAIVVGLFVWWLWPRPRLPQILVAAFDQVALPDEKVALRAQIEPAESATTEASLAGLTLYYLVLPKGDLLGSLQTDRSGLAGMDVQFPQADKPHQVLVRFPGEKNGPRQVQSIGRVFTLPTDTTVLLIDVDHGLVDGGDAKLWNANNLDIRPQPGATTTLRDASRRYRIVYLSAGADRPSRYNKLRAWLERGWARPQDQFPDGPVLAPGGSSDATDFASSCASGLKQRFTGKFTAVTNQLERAKAFRAAGVEMNYVVGQGESTEGIAFVKAWSDLASSLK